MARWFRKYWPTLMVVAVACALGVVLYSGWRSCEAQGGQYVRGLFWMECVK